MILQSLTDYYARKVADPDPAKRLPAFGLEEKEIPFVIELTAEGNWLPPIRDTRQPMGKKLVAQRFLVPKGIKKTSGVAANLLWDTAGYVLGADNKGKAERTAEQKTAFKARIETLPDTVKSLPGIAAVLAFLSHAKPEDFSDDPVWAEILESNPVLSFRLAGNIELICQHPAIMAALAFDDDEDAESTSGTCLVSGETASMERLHPSIKGVWGAQTSGANIVSFNLDAFNSYGKTQGGNAPVGKAAAFAYTTALNHLLAKDSAQRVQVGDSSTVFWSEKPSEFETLVPNLFGEPGKDDPDKGTRALDTLYRSVHTGTFALDEDSTRCHVLGLAPNAARIAVRFWETGTAAELSRRLRRHFDDLEIVRGPNDPRYLSLFRLLTAVAVQGKADKVPPNLGGEIVRAVLIGENIPYPMALLNAAIMRFKHQSEDDKKFHRDYSRAAIIKACLNRLIRQRPSLSEKEFLPMLDLNNPNPAYRLGRLFAVLEKAQEEASPGLNATIRDRYYGAASSTPVSVFTTLLRLKNHHLAKLTAGRRINLEKLIGEIMGGLDDFPRQLPLLEQGRFALGYYHQRQDFFSKRDQDTPDSSSTDKE